MGSKKEIQDTSKGIIPQSLKQIYDFFKNEKRESYEIFISYYELYMDKLHDLFNPENDNLSILEDNVKLLGWSIHK